MNDNNEKLSALMDGELERAAALSAIKALGQSDRQRHDWDCYHLIGDVLRGEDAGAVYTATSGSPAQATMRRRKSAEAIFVQLAAEPTVFAPAPAGEAARESAKNPKPLRHQPVRQKTRFALAMAASVLTVSAIGIVAFKQQQNGESVPVSIAKIADTATLKLNNSAAEIRVNDYLMVHRQFANPAALQAAALNRIEQRKLRQPAQITEQSAEQRKAVNQ